MAESTMRDVLDQLAQLRGTVQTQSAELAGYRRQRRHGSLLRRGLPVALAALFVALAPLSILAADPFFSDLNEAAPVHRPNIQAIGNVGITTGFADPNDPTARLYNPKGQVTREEMASFLARTAGLADVAPMVKAKTAQTADLAANANTVGGYTPSGLLRVARDTGTNTDPFSPGVGAFPITAVHPTFQTLPDTALTIQVPGPGFVLVSGTAGVSKGTDPGGIIAFAHLRDVSPGAAASAVSPKVATGSNSTNQEYSTLSMTYVFPVDGAGSKTFALEVARQGPTASAFNGTLTALFVPFAQDGGTTLAP